MTAVPPLFAAEPDNACDAYRNVRAAGNEHTQDARRHCEDLWKDFHFFADPQFLAEFPLRFHERWFEMYTTVALMRAGMEIHSDDEGPDILLTVDGRQVWIECVCATAGEPGLPDSVPERVVTKAGDPPVVTEVPHHKIVLRLRNSLQEKARKYKRYLASSIVTPDDLQIVALNVHAVPNAWPDMEDFMMRSLYGVGNLIVRLDRATGAIIGSEREQVATITKNAGAPVGVQPFIDGSMGHVTGVLGSRADAANRPVRLGDDLDFFPNLTAVHPWPGGLIQLGDEWTFVEAAGEWRGTRMSHMAGD